MMAWLRSIAYALVQIVVTAPYSFIALATFPLPPLARYRVISLWSRFMVFAARAICGIRYRVIGAENVPSTPSIILSKHESAWETMALQLVFPPQVWVLKRELLWIPFLGWGLAMLSPIAIDRADRRRALRQMLEQGVDRLKTGFSIVVFPEGTRSAPGVAGTYKAGGARLALHTGAPVVPVAHNAGDCWPRNSFLKRAGTVTISVGPAFRPHAGEQAPDFMNRVAEWIETETRRIRQHEPR
ncbi:MAG TPA: lysophospholipid acyltransferase family protein [Burkholderiales bacterium]|nr:lysophospholipid acyltransferase family protein [Burkholderiales bacterium]